MRVLPNNKINQVVSAKQVRQCGSGGGPYAEPVDGSKQQGYPYSTRARPPATAGGCGRFGTGVGRVLLQNGQGRRKEASGPPKLPFMLPFHLLISVPICIDQPL